MQCFICVTYLMIIATAHPPKDRDVSKTHEKRSIFNDVIQSLRMRAQLPEDINLNDENNIGQNYDRYGFENESLQLPNDLDFMPRRNDRIEMPPMKYRFPKSLMGNESFDSTDSSKGEIIVYVNTPAEYNESTPTTQKPKKQKRPRPTTNKNKIINKNEEDVTETTATNNKPFMNTMAGQSQIGNRESQTVVKPTVIVNFRGSVMHRESDIRLEGRRNDNDTLIPQNIFNINQEIRVEKTVGVGSGSPKKTSPNLKQDVNITSETRKAQVEEDMMMCETSSSKEKEGNNRLGRKQNVLQIMFTI